MWLGERYIYKRAGQRSVYPLSALLLYCPWRISLWTGSAFSWRSYMQRNARINHQRHWPMFRIPLRSTKYPPAYLSMYQSLVTEARTTTWAMLAREQDASHLPQKSEQRSPNQQETSPNPHTNSKHQPIVSLPAIMQPCQVTNTATRTSIDKLSGLRSADGSAG